MPNEFVIDVAAHPVSLPNDIDDRAVESWPQAQPPEL